MRATQMFLGTRLTLLMAATVLGAAPALAQRATAAPPWKGRVEEQSRAAVIAYASELQYADVPWSSDEQYLVFRGVRRLVAGPRAKIVPALGVLELSEEAMEEGRVIGWIESEMGISELGIAHGRTYVWVDRQGPDMGWRSLLVPADPAQSAFLCGVARMPHPPVPFAVSPHGFWAFRPIPEARTWTMAPHFSCKPNGCCEPNKCGRFPWPGPGPGR